MIHYAVHLIMHLQLHLALQYLDKDAKRKGASEVALKGTLQVALELHLFM